MADAHLRRQVKDARHQAILKRNLLRLAVPVVLELLEQSRTDAMRRAAAHVAVDRHWIDHGAAIVHRDIVEEADLPGLDIHFHYRHVAHMAHDRIENAEIAVAFG